MIYKKNIRALEHFILNMYHPPQLIKNAKYAYDAMYSVTQEEVITDCWVNI